MRFSFTIAKIFVIMYYVKSIKETTTMKTLNNIEIIINDNEVSYNYNGTLYTEDEFKDIFFPTPRLVKMPSNNWELVTFNRYINGQLSTGRDIGKLVAFFDKPDDSFITYGILYEVHLDEDYPYIREGDYSHWKYARRLTQKEIEELI